jgi:hypothetical protein
VAQYSLLAGGLFAGRFGALVEQRRQHRRAAAHGICRAHGVQRLSNWIRTADDHAAAAAHGAVTFWLSRGNALRVNCASLDARSMLVREHLCVLVVRYWRTGCAGRSGLVVCGLFPPVGNMRAFPAGQTRMRYTLRHCRSKPLLLASSSGMLRGLDMCSAGCGTGVTC